MRDLPRPVQVYISALFTLAVTSCLLAGLIIVARPEFILPAVALTLLVAFFDLHPVTGFKNVETTTSTAIKVSGVLLVDPSVVIVSTFLGTAFAESRLVRPAYKKVFNVGLMTTMYIVIVWIYTIVQGDSKSIIETPRDLFALAALAISELTLNSLILSLVIALVSRLSVRYIWLESFKPVVFHDLSMVPLGALIAMLWRLSPWAVLFATIPLILIQRSTKQINDLQRQILDALEGIAWMLDDRDGDTYQHCEMVSQHAGEIARVMGLGQAEIESIKRAAYLHDIGKIGMSDMILRKPGVLTSEEREQVKKHAAHGGDLLKRFPSLEKSALYVRHHHERWDGKGYPDGLKGEAIPLGARIIGVADSFQAMIEDRPYRKALALSAALNEIYRNAGTQFDPQVVRALFRVKQQPHPGKKNVSELAQPLPPAFAKEPDTPSDPKLINPQIVA